MNIKKFKQYSINEGFQDSVDSFREKETENTAHRKSSFGYDEANSLIAEFMGLDMNNILEQKIPFYNKSWDALMPVVRKIWELQLDEVEQDDHFDKMQETLPLAELFNTYEACVDFLRWYKNYKVENGNQEV